MMHSTEHNLFCHLDKGTDENEMANSLAKVATKKATHLHKKLTIDKNSKSYKYKEFASAICKSSLEQIVSSKKYNWKRII